MGQVPLVQIYSVLRSLNVPRPPTATFLILVRERVLVKGVMDR